MNSYKTSFRRFFMVAIFGGSALFSFAQDERDYDPTDPMYIRKTDQSRHTEWQDGKSQFPGRPRDMWQVGIGGGSFLISGDVKSQFGWGTSIHVRKSIGYIFSLKAEYMFGQARGLNYQASGSLAMPPVAPFPSGGGTPAYGVNDIFYANYMIPQFHAASLQMVFNLNNVRFHKMQNKWSLNLLTGVGGSFYNTRYDALDANGNKYDFSSVALGLDPSKLSDRKTIRDNIKSLLDGDYESAGEKNNRNEIVIGLDGKKNVTLRPYAMVGLDLEYLITKRISIGIEHQVFFSADDFLDGKTRKENGSLTSNTDIPHYTSVRLNFHIGKKDKRIQPLWFVNPLVFPMKDIADLKENLGKDLLADGDKDGVPDLLDKELNTPADAPVDNLGRELDSDKDGVPDWKDKEPFSPPGYPVNEDGVAQVPKPVTPEDVVEIGNKNYELKGACKCDCCDKKGGNMNEWYLPMIHFDLDKYYLRPESFAQLQHVAQVMKANPDLKVVVHGHTDTRANDDYNKMLSYNRAMTAIDFLTNNYGISKDRFVVKYDGKSKLLIPNTKQEPEHFINRRVEFYIATPEDKSQERPKGDGGVNAKWKY